MNTEELIKIGIALPAEEKILIIDRLLESLQETDADTEKAWFETAAKRWVELRSEEKLRVDGRQVFKKMWRKFE
jgi:hypothetical protein